MVIDNPSERLKLSVVATGPPRYFTASGSVGSRPNHSE
jgi:hypothetical protein